MDSGYQLRALMLMLTFGMFLFVGCGNESSKTQENSPGYIKTTNTFTLIDSNLTWQDSESVYTSNEFSFYDEAAAYCDALVLEGSSDWRLPTVDEYSAELFPNRMLLTYRLETYIESTKNYIFWADGPRYYPRKDDSYYLVFNLSNGRSIMSQKNPTAI